ncbi:potassium channel family protein [Sulfurovum sp. NBC37-1]|uniref:potassium channel family protein n=1 Tax=Sulfurovum sp. (strain NBC37-1) TaxID=387093 RepID=UPI0001587BFA|nr:potassium channel protein [Sulfurovum sp. NBC37-1]BAF72529.1 potassium channel protein [Sulfurovum sp. NBC37-1]
MKNMILSWALSINKSKRYREIKESVRDILNNPSNPYKRVFDIFIIFLIITSVFILIYEVEHPVPKWLDNYDIYFVSFVFFIEYILRLWTHTDFSKRIVEEYHDAQFLHAEFELWPVLKDGLKEKFHYMITPAAIIDLLAIFPAYRPLRVLRIFVLFRVLKLLRYTKSIHQFVEVLVNKRFELLTLLFLLLFIVVTAGIALYVLEEHINPNIDSLFDSIYWALITITTVGYGDISPVTDLGRSISMLIIVSGIAMISFATSVIVSAFSERLSEIKEDRIIKQINKSRSFLIICGYGQMAKMFFRQKNEKIDNYIILDKDPKRVEQAHKDGYQAIVEDASRFETLKKFNVEHSNITVLSLTGSDVENIYITLNAKSISRRIRVIARVNNMNIVSKFKYAGADHLLMPNQVANTMIRTAITQPTMYKAIHAILTGKSIARIDEIHVHERHSMVDKSVAELDFKANKLLLMGIERNGEFLFNPLPTERIQNYDILLLMGRQISIEYYKEIHEGGHG